MSREINVYRETYKKGAIKLEKKLFPVIKHAAEAYAVTDCEILAAGIVEQDGVRREYQDLRIYLEWKK